MDVIQHSDRSLSQHCRFMPPSRLASDTGACVGGADTADGTLGVVFFHVAHVCGMGRPRGAEPYTELQLWQRARRAATRGGLQAMWDELTTTCGRLELDTDDAQTAVPTTLSSEAAAEELSAANVMHGAAEGLNQGDQPCRQRPYCSQAPLSLTLLGV